MHSRFILSIFAPALVLGFAPALFGQHHDHAAHGHQGEDQHAGHTDADSDKRQISDEAGDPYYLATDPVTGEALPQRSDQGVIRHDGRELRFASEENRTSFLQSPDRHLTELDEAMAEDQRPHYPLTTCVVSDEPLEEKPIELVYRNRLVRFCCPGCRGDFKADPEAFMTKLDTAVMEQQLENYPLQTCPISKQALGSMGQPVDLVIANRLIRLCCAGCKNQLLDDPAAVIKALDDAMPDAADGDGNEVNQAQANSTPGHEVHTHHEAK